MTWLDGSWDFITVDGIRLPGRLSKLDIKPKRKIELTKPKGSDNPATKDQGYEGASVSIELELFKASQAEELSAILSSISPRQPGALANPHTLQHPLCVAANVTKVYFEDYTLSLPNKGRMRIPLTAHEWFPEEPAKKTKQGGAVKSGKEAGSGGPFDKGEVPPPDPKNKGANFP